MINKLMMLSLAVSDMPKAKNFYVDILGLQVAKDFRQDDHNWWISLTLPENSSTITLTTNHENMQPGTMKLYFATNDLSESHQAINEKGIKVSDIKDDLFGPGSGVKWFHLDDPDGSQIFFVQV